MCSIISSRGGGGCWGSLAVQEAIPSRKGLQICSGVPRAAGRCVLVLLAKGLRRRVQAVKVMTLSRAAEEDLREASSYTPAVDPLQGAVSLVTVSSMDLLEKFLLSCVHDGPWTREWGLQLLLFSLVLTRGAQRVAGEMDSGGALIGRYGYCNQELINLCITGRATTNVTKRQGMLSSDVCV